MVLFLFNPASWNDWQAWFGDHLTAIVVIIVAAAVIWWIYKLLVTRFLERAATQAARLRGDKETVSFQQRARTLSSTLQWLGAIVIGFIAVGLVLSQLGLNVSALIAGVGVVGIALGFGAQTLVRDLINGLFILIEDQYRVGDVVEVSGVTGEVVQLNPRRTVLRDDYGYVHVVPNGSIVVATNKTREFNRVNLTIHVAEGSDIDKAVGIVTEVGEQIARDHAGAVLAVPRVLRVDVLTDSGMDIKVTGDVRAGSYDEVSSLLRVAIKRRFEAEGIESRPEQDAGTDSPGAAAGDARPVPGMGLLPRPGPTGGQDSGAGQQ